MGLARDRATVSSVIAVGIEGRRVECGTAAEIAERLTSPERPITPDVVRDWARRGLIDRYHRPGRGRGTTWYRLDQAARVERDTRTSVRIMA